MFSLIDVLSRIWKKHSFNKPVNKMSIDAVYSYILFIAQEYQKSKSQGTKL